MEGHSTSVSERWIGPGRRCYDQHPSNNLIPSFAIGSLHVVSITVIAEIKSFDGVSNPSKPAQRLRHLFPSTDAGEDHIDHCEGQVEVPASVNLFDQHSGRLHR